MVGHAKYSWHLQLFLALCDYRMTIKFLIGFTPFKLVHGLKAILPIECEIPSLKLVVTTPT